MEGKGREEEALNAGEVGWDPAGVEEEDMGGVRRVGRRQAVQGVAEHADRVGLAEMAKAGACCSPRHGGDSRLGHGAGYGGG